MLEAPRGQCCGSRGPNPIGPQWPARLSPQSPPFWAHNPAPAGLPHTRLHPSACLLISVLLKGTPALFRVFPCTAQAFGNISKLETQLYFDYSSPSLTEVTLELGGRRKQHLGPVPGIALKDGCDRDLGLRGPGLDQQGRGWLVPGKRSCGHRLTDSSGKAESPGLASLGRGGPRAECPARRWMT